MAMACQTSDLNNSPANCSFPCPVLIISACLTLLPQPLLLVPSSYLCPFPYLMAFTDKFEKDEYYLTPEGYIVFTEKYHLKRGYCCQSGCRHCPWKKQDKKDKK